MILPLVVICWNPAFNPRPFPQCSSCLSSEGLFLLFFFFIQDVKISSAPLLLLRIPSLKIKTSLRRETFEANLKSECELWHLMIKELWAGRKMADEHKVGLMFVCCSVEFFLSFLLVSTMPTRAWECFEEWTKEYVTSKHDYNSMSQCVVFIIYLSSFTMIYNILPLYSCI